MSDYKPLEEVVGTFATKNTDPNYIYWKFTGVSLFLRKSSR